MNVHQVGEPVTGLPSFVRWSGDNPLVVDWWAPTYTGDPAFDYAAGKAHLQSAFELFPNFRDPSASAFYRALVTPLFADPRAVLTNIVLAMRVSGPIERGFIDALVSKAMAGRAPSIGSGPGLMEEDRDAEDAAHAYLELARFDGCPDFVTREITNAIDQTIESCASQAFVWMVCAAALAGALN